MRPSKTSASNPLEDYRRRRRKDETPEPFGGDLATGHGAFVIQKHSARALHYDLRLELGGVLLSWAVPKGPSVDPREKRLAVRTEDHPLEYAEFEGVIPEGNYGAGAMIVWDRGRWLPLEDPVPGLEKGKLLFELQGFKLKGVWTLVRTQKNPKEWLWIKKPDDWADSDDRTFPQESVFSGLTVEELKEGLDKAAIWRGRLQEFDLPRADFSVREADLMLARTVEKPFSKSGWIFELKYDGYRLLAGKQENLVQLRYRSGQDATPFFPELARAVVSLPASSLILDGEITVLDEYGKPSFQRLQRRGQRRQPSDIEAATIELPAAFFAFDILSLENTDLRSLPLMTRKELLREVLPPAGVIRYSEHFPERGEEVYAQVCRLGLEGMVAKKADSPYRGGRSEDWQKIHADRVSCFVIVGFTDPKGRRKGFGALHLGAFEDGKLVYAGRVGTGFSEGLLIEIGQELMARKRKTPPCEKAPAGKEHHWAEPELVCQVRYKEATEAGQLRQPRFEGIRDDVPPSDCLAPFRDSGPPPAPAEKREVPFSNRDKVFWPEEEYTKGDLIDYYEIISPWLLPYLKNRPLVLDRYPDGIHGKSFFQKNPPEFAPSWVRTEQIWLEDSGEDKTYFVCDDQSSLLYVINLAAIPLHVWSSRLDHIGNPDWCSLDLDPKEAPFEHVIQLALGIRELCEEIGVSCFVKTTGGTGLHILIPLGAQYRHEQAKILAEVLARVTASRFSDIATLERAIDARADKVYVDYLQNGKGKLLASPYCVRPRPGAPVSTPLLWEEVTEELSVGDFNMTTVPKRMRELQKDPLAPILGKGIDLDRVLPRLAGLVNR